MRIKPGVQAKLDAQKSTLEKMKAAFPLTRILISDLRIGDRKANIRTGTFSTVVAIRPSLKTEHGVLSCFTTKDTDGREHPLAGREDLYVYVWRV